MSIKVIFESKRGLLGLALTYFENFLRLFYGVGILLLARRELVGDEFAEFSFYLTVGLACYMFSRFSFDAYAIKEFVSNAEGAVHVLLRLVALRILGSLAVISIAIVLLALFGQLRWLLVPVIFLQFFRAFDLVELYLRARGNLLTQSVVRIFSMLLAFCFLLVSITFFSSSLEVFIYSQAIEWLSISIFYAGSLCFFCKAKGGANELHGTVLESVRKVLRGSVFVHISFGLFLVYSKFDQFLLKWVVAAGEYGDYMIAARLTEASIVLILSLNMFFYPKLVKAHRESYLLFNNMVRSLSIFFLLLSLLVVVVVWIFKAFYYSVPVLVSDYVPYEVLNLLSLLIFSTVPVFFFGLRSSYFSIVDSPRDVVMGGVWGVLCALLVGVPFVLYYGVFGAAIAVSIIALVALGFSNFCSRQGRAYLRIIFGFSGVGVPNK